MTRHTLHTDVDGNQVQLQTFITELGWELTFRNEGEDRDVHLPKKDIPALIRNLVAAADLDILVIEKPVGGDTKFAVDPVYGDVQQVQITYGFALAERLHGAEIIRLIWQLSEALAMAHSAPGASTINAIQRDLIKAGINLPLGSTACSSKLWRMGYRKDPAHAAPTGTSAQIFNRLPEAKGLH
jgi:hypothetical protein